MTSGALDIDDIIDGGQDYEWNKGDMMPPGGPLPRYKNSTTTIKPYKPVGTGKGGDPRVNTPWIFQDPGNSSSSLTCMISRLHGSMFP